MKKCVYCGKDLKHALYQIAGERGVTYPCCSEACKKEAKSFFQYYAQYKSLFLVLLFLSVGIVIAGFLGFLPYLFLFIGIALMEIDCLIFPFLFSSEKICITKAKRHSRILSVVLLAIVLALVLKRYVFMLN